MSFNDHYVINSFTCQLCREIMEDPVAISCGHSFERTAVLEWFDGGERRCPTCGEQLSSLELTPNFSLWNSIEEWKRSSMDLKMENAAAGIVSGGSGLVNGALDDLQALMKMPRYRAVLAERGLLPHIVKLLKATDINTKAALRCLCHLAGHSDDMKEAIVEAGGVRVILKRFFKGFADLDALSVLLELSENELVLENIGDTKDCITILVSLLNYFDLEISDKARRLLEKLSFNVHFVIKMAEAGHFQPFINRFPQGPPETKALMARDLFNMQLTEKSVKKFRDKPFVSALSRMLLSSFPACRVASLDCIRKLSSFPKMAKWFLGDDIMIPALLGIVSFGGCEHQQRSAAAEILTSLIQASKPSDFDTNLQLQELQCDYNVRLFLTHAVETSSNIRTNALFLNLLLAIAEKSSQICHKLRMDPAMLAQVFGLLNFPQGQDLKQTTLKLILCITQHNDSALDLHHDVKASVVRALVGIMMHSPEYCERTAAAGIISQLPHDDTDVDRILHECNALKSVQQVICAQDTHLHAGARAAGFGGEILENALGILVRYTDPTKLDLQKQLSQVEIYSQLVRILSTGSSLAKEQTAILLTNLSRLSFLSEPATPERAIRIPFQLPGVLTNAGWCCFLSGTNREFLCPVHCGACSPRKSFCLVKVNAVRPLVRALSEKRSETTEAALQALDSLLHDETVSLGAAVIAECQGVPAILDVLENGTIAAKEKALDIFDKIFKHSAMPRAQSQRFQTILIQLLQDDDFKKKAAMALSQMGIIPQESSYF